MKTKLTENNNFIIAMLVLFFPIGLYLMWKNAQWSKGSKIIVTAIFGVLTIGILTNDPDSEENVTEPKQEQTQATEKEETQQEESEENISEESESLGNEVVETETIVDEESEEISDDFRDNAGKYLLQLSDSYMVLGDLETAETETEMKAIIKQAQRAYDLTNEYYTALDPQNDKEQKLFDQITDIDTLASSALINAEDGMETLDVDLINQATEDIEASADIAEQINMEIE